MKIYEPGQKLRDAIYGPGVVLEADADYTTIRFRGHGIKKFITSMLRMVPLEDEKPAPSAAPKASTPRKSARKQALKPARRPAAKSAPPASSRAARRAAPKRLARAPRKAKARAARKRR